MIAKALIIGALTAGMFAPSGPPGEPEPVSGSQAAGKAIFEGKGNCATCHGREGKGTPLGPDLTDGEWLNASGSLEDLQMVIRQGVTKPKKFPAPMPAMGGARLSDDEIGAVARYVLELVPARAGS
jgi:cbb3-type cytochrome c oxidase subunit III